MVVHGSQVFEIEPQLFAALEAGDAMAEQELRHSASGFAAPRWYLLATISTQSTSAGATTIFS